MTTKYKHLFFDLDGTLWDLHKNTRAAMLILFDRYADKGLKDVDFETFFSRYHHHNDQAWALYRVGKIEKASLRVVRFERSFGDAGLIFSPEFIDEFADAFLDVCPRQPALIEGARELLDKCLEAKIPMHIITNGFVEVQGTKMASAKIDHYFLEVINSEDAGVRKPHPQIFQYALDRAGATKEESLMIGDDWDADIIGARDFGMDHAFLTTTEDMLDRIHGTTSRHNHKAHYTISNLSELLPVLGL
jgi:putative hydrolase of the HAD superfamily